jgi:Helix-turn-helix domain
MARPALSARPPTDPAEERTLRRLASARHAPASLIQRARIITASWDGASVAELAQWLGCHPKTVYKWLHRFNADGLDGLADLPRPGLPGGSASTSAAGSSSWPAHNRPAACTRAARGCWPRPARGAGALDPGRLGRSRPGRGHRRGPQPGPPDPAQRTGALAAHAVVGDQHDPDFVPKGHRSSPAPQSRPRRRR